MKKKEKNEVVELYYDFQKAYDNVNHAFLEELLDVWLPHRHSEPNHRDDGSVEEPPLVRGEGGEVGLRNGIIQGDSFSPLLFVLMIDPSSRN